MGYQRKAGRVSAQEGALANIHDICRGVVMQTIARRKILPTANHEEHTEGESWFFAAVSDHFSVHAELSVAKSLEGSSLSDCPPSSLLPLGDPPGLFRLLILSRES